VAGKGKDPKTRTPQAENANTENKDEGDRRTGKGREPTSNKQQTTNAKSEPIRSRFPNYSSKVTLQCSRVLLKTTYGPSTNLDTAVATQNRIAQQAEAV
jgi:hypothetical protein